MRATPTLLAPALLALAGCGLFVPGVGEGEGEGEGEPQDCAAGEGPLDLAVCVEGRGAAIPIGYPLRVVFDHRAMVVAGAALDGSDLRLSFEGEALDFRVEPDGGFNRADTAIWFESPAAVADDGVIRLELTGDDDDPSGRGDFPFVGFEAFDQATLDESAFRTTTCDAPANNEMVCAIGQSGGAVVLQSRGPSAAGKAIGFLARIDQMETNLVVSEIHYNGANGGGSRYFAIRLGREATDQTPVWTFRKHEDLDGLFEEEDLEPYNLGDLVRVDFAIDFERERAEVSLNGEIYAADVPPSTLGGGDLLTNFQTGVKTANGASSMRFLHMYERVSVVPQPRVRAR